MATVKFSIQKKTGNAMIYARLSLGRDPNGKTILFKRKTNLFINPMKWDVSKGFPKQIQKDNHNTKLRNDLLILKVKINKAVTEANARGEIITGDWLSNVISNEVEPQRDPKLDYLTVFGQKFLDDLPYRITKGGMKGVAKSTEKKYKTILNKLIAFEKYRKRTILIRDVDLKLNTELIKYFSKVDGLGNNTIGRYLKFVKTICLDAKKQGAEVSPQLEYFKGFTVEAPKVTLSFEEIELITKADIKEEKYQVARDWLVLGNFIGQRVSDLLRINKSFIQQIQGFDFIVLKQVKTGKTVQIPIHKEVRKVLDKRGGEFPPVFAQNMGSNAVFFNRYIKEVCKIAKINTIVEGNYFDKETKRTVLGMYEKHLLVSSHVCRRSFATNFYADPKYPTPLLMNITAHATERQFLEYIGKKPIDFGLQLAEIWATEL